MIDRAEYAALDAIDLAGLIRKGEVAQQEVLSASLDAIAHVNPTIQAIASVPELQGAHAPAGAGPLAGAPFLLKDLGVFRAGTPSEAGSRLCRDFRPPFTSTMVERYDAAGLVTLGRTKSPEFGFSPTTEPALYGPVRNPWNPAHSSGGSSGGAAAAVAAGCVPVAHANDAGGSIRIPAGCCGVFGLKPTRGRIPCGPAFSETVCGLGADHVVSRSVRDSALVLDLTQGPAPGDPYGVSNTIDSHLGFIEKPLQKLRIALWSKAWSGASLAPDIAQALDAAAKLCADLGHEVEAVEPDFGTAWEAFLDANATVWCSNVASLVDFFSGMLQRPISTDTLEEATLAAYRHGKQRSATDLLASAGTFNLVSRAMASLFSRFDVVLSPVMTRTTPLLGDFVVFRPGMTGADWCRTIFDQIPFTPVFNVTGGPAASVPLGQDGQGMPIGIHIAADLGNEGLLLNLARQFETIAPWASHLPPVHAAH